MIIKVGAFKRPGHGKEFLAGSGNVTSQYFATLSPSRRLYFIPSVFPALGDSLARPIRALALPGNKGLLLKSLTIRLCDNKADTVLDSERDSGPEFLKFLCHSPSNGDNGVTIFIV